MKKQIRILKRQVIRVLEDGLSDSDAYSQDDIDCCEDELNSFLEQLRNLPSKEQRDYVLEVVELTLETLEELNTSCDEGLIDSELGDELCEFMAAAVLKTGLVTNIDHIIENSRKW